MPTLKKRALEEYLRTRFGPEVTLLSFGVIGKASSKGAHKQYGYGTPVKLTYRIGREVRAAVLETMKPGPFGHEHMADRAQAMLWDYESYGRLPRHVKALDVGAFTGRQKLFSVAEGREYFVLNQWTEGGVITKIWNGWPRDDRFARSIADGPSPLRDILRRFTRVKNGMPIYTAAVCGN